MQPEFLPEHKWLPAESPQFFFVLSEPPEPALPCPLSGLLSRAIKATEFGLQHNRASLVYSSIFPSFKGL